MISLNWKKANFESLVGLNYSLKKISFLILSMAVFIGVYLLYSYNFHVDWERIAAGKPNLIHWDKYLQVLPIEDIEFDLQSEGWKPKMYPVTDDSIDRLRKKINFQKQHGYALRDNERFFVGQDFNWGSDKNSDRNWHFKINSWDMLVPYFQLYELTGQSYYLEMPVETIIDWIDFNLIDNHENKMKWHDMASGLRAVQLALLLKSDTFQNLKPSTQSKVYFASKVHVKILSSEWLLTSGNHGLFQLIGLRSLCKAMSQYHECKDESVSSQLAFSRIMRAQFTLQGIHKEHSSYYHLWAIDVLQKIKSLKLFRPEYFEVLNKARINAKWLFHPNGDLTLFGDSDRRNIDQYAGMTDEIDCLLGLGNEVPTERIGDFSESGYLFYRNSWDVNDVESSSYLAISSTNHSTTHKQNDDMTFEWSEFTTPIILDSGKYSYDSDELSQYFRSSQAHNIVSMDDQRFDFGLGVKSEVSGINSHGVLNELFWAKATPTKPKIGWSNERFLILSPGNWLLIIDQIDTLLKQKLTQKFHLSPSISIGEYRNGSYELKLPVGNNKIYTKHYFYSNALDPTLNEYSGELVRGWISYKYKQATERKVLTVKTRGESGLIMTMFSVNQSNFELIDVIQIGEDKLDLCWRLGDTITGLSIQANQSIMSSSSCDERYVGNN